jgi:hypothetical protein
MDNAPEDVRWANNGGEEGQESIDARAAEGR